MQNNIVKAYRQRLIRHGYTDVVIYDDGNGYFSVYCNSPYGTRIRATRSLFEMEASPRVVFFNENEFKI